MYVTNPILEFITKLDRFLQLTKDYPYFISVKKEDERKLVIKAIVIQLKFMLSIR